MAANVIVVGPTTAQLGLSIGKWIQENTIALAETSLVAEVKKGFDPQPVIVTDGVVRRDPREVKVGGKIEFIARTQIADAVLWALAELVRRSPIGPAEGGHYKDDHVILLNGTQIVGNVRAALTKVQSGDKIQIVNPRVYARRLESATANSRGREKRRAGSRQAPGGIYRPVHRALIQRYGKSVFVDFKYVKLNTGVKVWGKVGGARKIKGKVVGNHNTRARAQRDQVYPALEFFVKPSQATGVN